MAKFELAYAITMKTEGGYANHPADTGGMTYKGVARNFNPKWSGWPIVDEVLSKVKNVDVINSLLGKNTSLQSNVRAFYKANYWDTLQLDSIASQELGEKLFDISVNMGSGRASKMLQEALNLSNSNGQAYPEIAVDGVIGVRTLALTNKHPRPVLLLRVVKALQAERYLNIMRSSPNQEIFANTWFSRV